MSHPAIRSLPEVGEAGSCELTTLPAARPSAPCSFPITVAVTEETPWDLAVPDLRNPVVDRIQFAVTGAECPPGRDRVVTLNNPACMTPSITTRSFSRGYFPLISLSSDASSIERISWNTAVFQSASTATGTAVAHAGAAAIGFGNREVLCDELQRHRWQAVALAPGTGPLAQLAPEPPPTDWRDATVAVAVERAVKTGRVVQALGALGACGVEVWMLPAATSGDETWISSPRPGGAGSSSAPPGP